MLSSLEEQHEQQPLCEALTFKKKKKKSLSQVFSLPLPVSAEIDNSLGAQFERKFVWTPHSHSRSLILSAWEAAESFVPSLVHWKWQCQLNITFNFPVL